MYVEKLQLHGFKSFVARTEIPFSRGITAIVGPNGCGKSNVSDAFRWVIGESNVRNLRGERIQDVIFKGTRTAKPLGMAEVTLFMRNDDGMLPVEYAHVGIARRIFRSGDSEFAINKVPCRLKDIRDLFAGTGLGSHGYAVIERLMIDEVLSDRAEARRFLFEEAAGVVKYKQRRAEARRKLEGVEGDLVRIEDMIREIEREVRSLARQAGKVRRWKRLEDELRRLEVRDALEEWRGLRDRSLSSQVIHRESAAKRQQLTSEVAALDAKREVERQRLAETADEADRTQRRMQIAVQAVNESLREIGVLSARNEAWVNQAKDLEARWERDERKRAEADAEVTRIEPLLEERETRFQQVKLRFEAARKAREEAELTLREARQRLNDTQQTSLDLRSNHRETIKDLESQEARKTESRARLESLAGHLVTFSEREVRCALELSELETRLSEISERIRAGMAARAERGNQRDEVQLRRQQLTERRGELGPRSAGVESRLALLEEQHERHEGFEAAVRWILEHQAELPGVIGVVGEAVRLMRDQSDLGQTVLGPTVSWILVEDEAAAISAIGRLREEHLGGVTFFPLAEAGTSPGHGDPRIVTLFDCDPVALPFLGYLASAARGGDSEHEKPRGRRHATEEGILFGSDGTLYLAGGRTGDSEVLSRAQEIPELRIELAALTAEIAEVETELESCRAEEKELTSQVSRIEEDLEAEERKKSQASEQRSALRAEHQMLSEERIRLTEEHANLQRDIERVEETLLRLQGTLDQTGIQSTRAEEEFETTRARAEEAERHRDQRVREAAEREMDHVRHEREVAELQSNLQRLRKEIQEGASGVTATREQLAAGAAESERGAHRITELQEGLGPLQQSRKDEESAVDRLRETLTETQSAIRELEVALKERRQILDEVTQSLHHEDVERVRAVSEAEQIRRRVVEEFGVDLESWDPETGMFELPEEAAEPDSSEEPVVALRHPDELPPESAPDDDDEENWEAHLKQRPRGSVLQLNEEDGALDPKQRRERIRELRARMEAMGSLNYLAEAEYQTQTERLEFHEKQATDLRTARTDLLEAIQKINETAGQMFKETFDLVQQKFQEVFGKLFPGGEATLSLAGPDSLEDDVEISARPRGKRLESIRLLSTGERALTAIALLFSLYLIKPSPVCLLDEVDAPLDDANLDRFLAMLQEMSERTQFIVITHNKKTMQVADNLFGVTMEEPGISKIVSVRLNGADMGDLPELGPELARTEDPAGAI